MKKKGIKVTKEFKDAFHIFENSLEHIFLTGRAGTGKSTLLTYFREHTNKKHVVLAPTGIAALNVKGQTIHSFFGFHPKIEKKLVRRAQPDSLKFFEEIQVIIIDEISMVRADLLDCVDKALRLNRGRPMEPFGGVQMIFIGDLFQLPPVVTRDEEAWIKESYLSPYFFSADCMLRTPVRSIELEKVHRQKDASFVKRLNKLRAGTVTEADIDEWNQCHDPFCDAENADDYGVHLTTTNKMAKARNDYELDRIESKLWKLQAYSTGDLGTRKMPSESTIDVKVGARIMFTANDMARRWVNGSLGTIEHIKKSDETGLPILEVVLDDGELVEVAQHKWEIFEYKFDGKNFEEDVVGSYSQHPIVLAWAVTIHKAQGKTFDKVLIDVGWGAFAHGQIYVALSRCTSFKGITLLKELRQKDVIIDKAVLDFVNSG